MLLGLVTLALYWPATGFGFVNYDDPQFITANAHVQGGLNWEGVKWAFRPNEGDYWHPLTWLSLMLDASLFGQKAGGFHFTNVALHAANSVLLFLLLRMLTGAFVAERGGGGAVCPASAARGVGGLGDGTQGCAQRLLRPARADLLRPLRARRVKEAESRNQKWAAGSARVRRSRSLIFPASIFYLLSLCFFACGLMSKAMLVTWPFVMLLLDYWPLGRMQHCSSSCAARSTLHTPRYCALVREKLPFFMLSGIVRPHVLDGKGKAGSG